MTTTIPSPLDAHSRVTAQHMAKRRASRSDSGSDSSDVEETPSKRARIEVEEDDADLEEETRHEKELEAKFGDRIRAAIESRNHIKGGVAQSGIIQSLEMHQFMCHPRLSFTFGPQINFIIGHNGSGKSAVLSAITIALGGKAITTGRGSGLRSFIREGQSHSEVTITLKNEGEEAFKPDVYGKSIVITRRFSRDGTSSYKIKNKDGKVISTKREELSAICDHMNIQVDNPLNVLSQDSARQFLSSSHPRDKYEFFLKGTQLQQLSEEYAVCLQNCTNQHNVIQAKKEALPALEEARKQARARYGAARKALETRAKISDLKRELAWSHVKAKEDEMKEKIEDVAKAGRKTQKLKKSVKEAEAAHTATSRRLANLEAELGELGNMDTLNERKNDVQNKIRENRDLIRELASNMKRMDEDIKRNTEVIKQLQAQIEEEERKLEVDKQAEREERERKINETKGNIDEQELILRDINDKIRSTKERLDGLTQRKGNAEKDKVKYEQEVQQCFEQLRQVENQAKNRLNAYGRSLPEVLQRINSLQWHGQVPLGPIGSFLTLHDQQWAQVMRIQLGNLVRSFAITDPRDKTQLKRILAESGNHHMQIIVSEVDLFDYSSGEPSADVLTVLRALSFTNEYVKRIFINQARIERIVLAPLRREGEQVASSLPGGGVAWTADLYRVTVYGDGGASSSPMTLLSPGDNRMLLFIDSNLANEKAKWMENGRNADRNLDAATNAINTTVAELRECRNEMDSLIREAKAVNERLRVLRRERDVLIEQYNEDVPVNIGALQLEKQSLETDKEKIITQFKHAVGAKAEIDEKQPPLLNTLNEIKEQIANFEMQKNELANKVTTAAKEHVEVTHNLEHWQKKLQEENNKISTLEKAVTALQAEYEEWTKTAEDYCDGFRVNDPRKADELQRLIKSSEKALKDQEKAQGATTEELEAKLREAERKYAAAQKDLKDLTTLHKALKSAMNDRMGRWDAFRHHIALRTKLLFQHLLANRAYYGKVLFDHEKQRLELKVQTDDQAATQGLNKDPKSLSGGEKSFSTICLLLALWQAIGCPIRCLDEFDVFMDAVNRRISMKMIIDTANSSDSKQYVLITPQDMSAVPLGPTVRVHRMGDPERGQNTLAF